MAEGDLADVWRYTKRQWSQEQAIRYTLTLKAMCAILAVAPQQAQSCAHIRPGYRRRSVGHHIIYFRVTSYGIAVIRILHPRIDAIRHL